MSETSRSVEISSRVTKPQILVFLATSQRKDTQDMLSFGRDQGLFVCRQMC